jgi:FKBP-type peptidyl-prolyl cis-trans isomerase
MIDYSVSLLDGTECYSSKSTGPQEFRIGQDNVESGLHEAILLMKVGDKARFILPPHLAHGLIGDQNKIPAMSTIIYDVELKALR